MVALNTAVDFRRYWHTLSADKIKEFITQGKLRKGAILDTNLHSEGVGHVGAYCFSVRYQVNEGTAEAPSWVTCYQSGNFTRELTPQEIISIYQFMLTQFPTLGSFFVEGYGEMPDIAAA